jgi:hypothetical protein
MAGAEARAAARLGRLLAAERKALREGRHDLLHDLATRKAEIVADLAATAAGAAALIGLRPQLDRQQRLLAAAQDGLRAARDSHQRRGLPLRTYGPEGLRDPAGPAGDRVVRRV